MSDWKFLNKHRIPPGKSKHYGSRPSDGFNGAFHLPVNGIPCLILASDGLEWRHVSVSIPGKKHTASWDMMCKIKAMFWNEEDTVMQLHVPKSLYVNHHPGCLHLWQPIGKDVVIPLPAPIMVGHKFEDGRYTREEPGVPGELKEKMKQIEKDHGLT